MIEAPAEETQKDPASIREFRFPQDYQSVLSLWRNAGPGIHIGRSDEEAEILKKLQRDGDLFLVAEVDNRIGGAVLGGYDGRRGIVYHLAVEKDLRGRGIGRALMSSLEDRLKAKGCLKVYLLVTKDNSEAIEFYTASGWDKMELYIFGKEL